MYSEANPTPITITITATTALPHPPGLSDGLTSLPPGGTTDTEFTTVVITNQTVNFVVSGDVTAITKIVEGTGSGIFKQNPTPENNFVGVIGAIAAEDTREYTIYYTVKDAPNNPYKQDPKLLMKK